MEPLSGFSNTPENSPAGVQTKVYMAYDQEAFYFAFDCDEPNPFGLKMDAKDWRDRYWYDDAVAVFIVPQEGERYQFALTPKGIKYDQYRGPDKKKVKRLRFAYGKECPAAVKIGKKNWVVEIKLPFKALEIEPRMAREWRINFVRHRPQERLSMSSWARVSNNWRAVKAYGYLKGLKLDGVYQVDKSPLDVERVVLEERPSVSKNSMRIRLRTHTSGEYRIETMSRSPGGKELVDGVDIEAKGVAEYTIPYRLAMEEGEHEVSFVITDAKDSQDIFRSSSAVVKIPEFLDVFNDRNYYTHERQCLINVHLAEALAPVLEGKTVSLLLQSADGNRIIMKKEQGKLVLKQRIPLELSDLAHGKYPLEATLLDENNTAISRQEIIIEKYRTALNEIKIDREKGTFLVNDQPFFPLSWYFQGITDPEAGLKHLSSLGFNSVLLSYPCTIDEIARGLDLADKYGMKVNIYWEMAQLKYSRFDSFDSAIRGYAKVHNISKQEQFEYILGEFEKMVVRVKNHPALFGYYMFDEPADSVANRNGMQRIIATVKKHDLHHPVWVSLCKDISILPSTYYNEYYDVVGTHVYWDNRVSGLSKLALYADKARPVVAGLHMPFLQTVPGGLTSTRSRELTASEHRAQRYLVLIHGVTGGMNYFTYHPKARPIHAGAWEELGKINAETKRLLPIIAETSPDHEIVEPPSSPVHTLLKVHQGRLYLLAVNIRLASQKVSFDGNFFTKATRTREFFKGTRLSRHDNGFSDTIAGQDSRVYEISDYEQSAVDKLHLEVSCQELSPRVDKDEFFAAGSGAYAIESNAIFVYGRGNTLASIARDIGDDNVFSWNNEGRKAVTSARLIRVTYGGEVIIGDREKPLEGETLEFSDGYDFRGNGTIRIYNSRIRGGEKGKVSRIHPLRRGKLEIVNSHIEGIQDIMKRLKREGPNQCLLEKEEYSENGNITATIRGYWLKRYSYYR